LALGHVTDKSVRQKFRSTAAKARKRRGLKSVLLALEKNAPIIIVLVGHGRAREWNTAKAVGLVTKMEADEMGSGEGAEEQRRRRSMTTSST